MERVFLGERSKNHSSLNRKWISPESCKKKLETWRDKGTVLNLIVSGGGLNVDVTISSFVCKPFGGGGDYSYSIEFYIYRPMKIQTTKELGIDTKKKKTTERANPKKETDVKKETHEVAQWDDLWSIARRYYGGSGEDWIKIYNANKTVIEQTAKKHGYADSDKGHWIFPKTVLTIPS